jgi:hypothetical protein
VSPEREIGPIFQFTGAAIGFNPEDRFMVTIGHTLFVTTQNGSVFGSNAVIQPTPVFSGTTIDGHGVGQVFRAELAPVVRFRGAQVAFNPQDRFLVALGGILVVITRNGDVFGHDVIGQDIGPARQLNHPEFDIQVSTRKFQINPELEITGRGFTPIALFNVTISNVPGKSGDILRRHSADDRGKFFLNESFNIKAIGVDDIVPNIRVVALDEATARVATGEASAEPFVSRPSG